MRETALEGIDTVILAGGEGRRLASVLHGGQKVVASVGGCPFLERLVEYVIGFGARRIILALGYGADEVLARDWASIAPGIEVIPSIEPRRLGTGGALRFALRHLATSPVLAMNGDTYLPADLKAFVAFHRRCAARLSVALARLEEGTRYGVVTCDEKGAVTAFREKDRIERGPAWVNAGLYLIERDVLAAIPPGRAVSLEYEIIPPYSGNGLYGFEQNVPFIDIGTPHGFRAAQAFFSSPPAGDAQQ